MQLPKQSLPKSSPPNPSLPKSSLQTQIKIETTLETTLKIQHPNPTMTTPSVRHDNVRPFRVELLEKYFPNMWRAKAQVTGDFALSYSDGSHRTAPYPVGSIYPLPKSLEDGSMLTIENRHTMGYSVGQIVDVAFAWYVEPGRSDRDGEWRLRILNVSHAWPDIYGY